MKQKMIIYVFTKKRMIILLLLLASLMFLTRTLQAGEKENFKPRFSIKLTFGRSYLSIGDFNKYLESINDVSDLYTWESVTGEIKELNNYTYDWEGELRIDISRRFAVGLSTSGSIHRKNESYLYLSRKVLDEEYIDIVFTKPEVKVWMPVKLGVYFNFLYTSKLKVFSTLGLGYYSASISEYKKIEEVDPYGDTDWAWRNWEINHKGKLSFIGGIGMEYYLTKNLALVVEAQGMYAKIKNLKGSMQKEQKREEGRISKKNGTLYYFIFNDEYFWDAPHIDIEIREESPEYQYGYVDTYRKASMDLSGFSLRVGIIIKLF
jgi:hypothetical protein